MNKTPLVLLHGWGVDNRCWLPIMAELENITHVIPVELPGFGSAPSLPRFTLDAVLNQLALQLPATCVLMGWSLGGMLAIRLAALYPQKVKGMITLATNPKFVADDNYLPAMAPDVNQQFNAHFKKDPVSALKLFTGLLAQGDDQERALLKKLRQQTHEHTNTTWQEALELLATLDNRLMYSQLRQPGLHLLGEKDVLVPASASEVLQGLNPIHASVLLPGVAHAIHWSQPQLVVEQVKQFLMQYDRQDRIAPQKPAALDKKKIAYSFSRAATTYDQVAGLQRNVRQTLAAKMQLQPQDVVLDLGSGTGGFAAQLVSSVEQVIGLDIAEGMLAFAQHQHDEPVDWICGDAESLPLANKSISKFFSSLAIQWCSNLEALAKEMQRVLKPGGQIYLSTLGPKTLHELKAAWQQVDTYVHVNQFATETQLRRAFLQAGLQLEAIECESRVIYFDSLGDLTHSLKALGAHNINPGQSRGLTGRQHLLDFKAAYEAQRTQAGLPLTYEVFYLTATKIAA